MRRTLAIAALVVIPAAGIAGEPSGAAQAEQPLDVTDVDVGSRPHVSFTVTALAGLAELSADQVKVYEDGEPRAVSVRKFPSDALEVVLVIDTSGSMQGEPMAQALAAAMAFVRAMPAEARIAVVGFGSRPATVAAFGTPTEELVAAIGTLRAAGETALYDGLAEAGEHLAVSTTPGARRFIVLLSDGGDTASTATLPDAVNLMAGLSVGFHAVALATEETDLGALAELARATDGQVVAASEPAEITALYADVAAQLVSQYEVTYQSRAEGDTRLEVVVDAEGVTARWQQTIHFDPLPRSATPAAAEPPRPYTAPAPGWLEGGWLLTAGAIPVAVGLGVAAFLLAGRSPPRRRLARELGAAAGDQVTSALTDVTARATALAERVLERAGDRESRLDAALERAGLLMRPAEFVVLVATVAAAGMAVSVLVWAPWAAAVVGPAIAGAAGGWLSTRAKRRQRRLADQLGDTVQLLAGALRAGHGLIQALDTVTREAESPTAEEFRRVIVEARLGRDLADALDALARRGANEDVEWVVQAIRIHREVGGDLAEILDRVGETIRDRNRVRGQIRSLTAEGRLSALILMALPFLVGGWMWFTNRPYVSELVERPQGRVILAVGAVLMTLGALVMRRLVRPQF